MVGVKIATHFIIKQYLDGTWSLQACLGPLWQATRLCFTYVDYSKIPSDFFRNVFQFFSDVRGDGEDYKDDFRKVVLQREKYRIEFHHKSPQV